MLIRPHHIILSHKETRQKFYGNVNVGINCFWLSFRNTLLSLCSIPRQWQITNNLPASHPTNMSTVQPSAQVPQNRQRVKLQTTPEGREALRDVLSWAIRNNGEIDPVLLQRVMAHGLLKQAILNAVVVVRDRDRKKKGEREKKMRQQQQSNASNSGDGQAALQMNPQLDTIKAAHCKKLVALRNEAHRSSQSFVANEDLTKARTETMASINALNCAFVRFVGDNNFVIIQPAEKEAEKMYNSGQTVQCRWKENTNVSCEKTQKDLQKSALMDALNSAKVKHCEGPGGNVTFELEIKSEVIRRMKQLLGRSRVQ